METAHRHSKSFDFERDSNGQLLDLALVMSVRTLHPRRNFPVVQVFTDGQLLFEEQVWREDAKRASRAVAAQFEDIRRAFLPERAAARIIRQSVIEET